MELKQQIKDVEKHYKERFVDLIEESKKVDEDLKLLNEFIQSPHTTEPEKITGDYGLKLANYFDQLGDLLAKVELHRKDLHDKIDHFIALFQIAEKMRLEKLYEGQKNRKVTDGHLKRLSDADDDLYTLRLRYNSFEALYTHIQKKREMVWELIQLLKKTADAKVSFAQTIPS